MSLRIEIVSWALALLLYVCVCYVLLHLDKREDWFYTLTFVVSNFIVTWLWEYRQHFTKYIFLSLKNVRMSQYSTLVRTLYFTRNSKVYCAVVFPPNLGTVTQFVAHKDGGATEPSAFSAEPFGWSTVQHEVSHVRY